MNEERFNKGRTQKLTIAICESEGFGPREHTNLGVMVCFHSSYELGDIQVPAIRNSIKEYVEDLEIVTSLPLFINDHSGITMNTTGYSCRWDSGEVGLIYITKEDLDRVGLPHDTNIDTLQKYLKDEVLEYAHYLEGSVWGYKLAEKIVKPTCSLCGVPERISWVELDSACGFLGDDHETNGLLHEARDNGWEE